MIRLTYKIIVRRSFWLLFSSFQGQKEQGERREEREGGEREIKREGCMGRRAGERQRKTRSDGRKCKEEEDVEEAEVRRT